MEEHRPTPAASAPSATLSKAERISSKKLIDELFMGGRSKSMTAFPLRAVYMELCDSNSQSMMLVSVPKKCFKHAVDRNRAKRQVREGYRRHKAMLDGKHVAVAFIWLDGRQHATAKVMSRVENLMQRISEKLSGGESPTTDSLQ